MNASLTAVRLSQFALRFIVIVSFTAAILSLLLWLEGDFDRESLLAHNRLRDNPAIVALFRAVTRFGMSAICLLLLSSVIASYRFPALRPARPVLLVVLFAFSAATLIGELLKELLGRARPITDLAGQLNAAGRHGSPSFPSGHAAKSLALALPFVFIVPAGSAVMRIVKLALIVVASLVCYSRIVLGAHYLSDVVAGAALALACIPIAVAAANGVYARGRVTPEKLDSVVKRLTVVLLALTFGLPFL
ncbi:MAG: phosphatase PAP2 family protein [Bryobacterales bacterium]|nr:phosphatase PAP2 family protein [Bryobacterales bacterium]